MIENTVKSFVNHTFAQKIPTLGWTTQQQDSLKQTVWGDVYSTLFNIEIQDKMLFISANISDDTLTLIQRIKDLKDLIDASARVMTALCC